MGKSDFDRSLEAFGGLIAAVREVAAALRGGMSGGVEAKLDTIIVKLDRLIDKEENMSGELDALKAAVTKNNDLIDSAITLIQGIKAALDAAILSGDPAALAALSASLGAEDDKLAAAIVANTPPGGGGGGGTPTALAAGQVGVAYSAAATGHGGLAPLSFTLSGGALPDGLSLDLTSGAITGTPTVAGDFAFAVTFTDADAATPDVVDNYTIAIAA